MARPFLRPPRLRRRVTRGPDGLRVTRGTRDARAARAATMDDSHRDADDRLDWKDPPVRDEMPKAHRGVKRTRPGGTGVCQLTKHSAGWLFWQKHEKIKRHPDDSRDESHRLDPVDETFPAGARPLALLATLARVLLRVFDEGGGGGGGGGGRDGRAAGPGLGTRGGRIRVGRGRSEALTPSPAPFRSGRWPAALDR